MVDVIVDMTALNTGSRERGIGRYVRGLCSGLAQHSQADGPSIAGLIRHHGSAAGALDDTLSFDGDPSAKISGLYYQKHKMMRRLFLGGLVRRTGASLVHLPDPPGTPIDMRTPRIVTCHDLIPLLLHKAYLSRMPGSRARQWARDFARYRTAHRVIAVSASTKRDLVLHLGVRPAQIDVVHHGVDHERFDTTTRPGERQKVATLLGFEGPYVLYLGAYDARKNVPMLIRAYGRSGLAGKVPLVLVGSASKRQRAAMDELIREQGLSADVLVRGYVEDDHVPALYRNCLLHVFPSSYEGFGLPVLEAMACGAPTISSQLTSMAEVAGQAALILPELNEDAMASALGRLASDTTLQADLRARGLSHASKFTWSRCAEQTRACYVRALEELRA
jgi:glycosyltransferase involved in cell wall biosynthesis